jgi:carbohydrate kinase (thermoresistant glucokinase family)
MCGGTLHSEPSSPHPRLPPSFLSPKTTTMAVSFFIIAGPPGAGKSTIGPILAKKLDFSFFEGDLLVSDEDLAALATGVPFSHEAHLQWMDDIIDNARRVELESSPKGIVATCTSLTKQVRDRLQNRVHELNKHGSKLELAIIWCDISKEESFRRSEKRKGHHYNPVMTEWIFARTEVPCVKGVEKEENIYLVDASQKVEDVICVALKNMEAHIKEIE